VVVRMEGEWKWLNIVCSCFNGVEPSGCYCSVAVTICIVAL